MTKPDSRPATLLLLGHVDHGKSTLLRTMLERDRSGGRSGPDPRDLDETEIPLGWGITHRRVERIVRAPRREYRVIDCPGHQDAVKVIATGAHRPHAAVLVVSAVDGPLAQTREQLLLAGEAGIELAAVFLSKIDTLPSRDAQSSQDAQSPHDAQSSRDDGGVIDRVEKEVRDLLRDCGHGGDRRALGAVPVLRGSAKSEASVSSLLEALDERIPDPPPEDGPFLFRVDSVRSGDGSERELVGAGFVLRGVIEAGQAVEAIGFSREASQAFVVKRVESGRHRQKRARAGDTVDLVFADVSIAGFDRGTVLAAPNTIAAHTKFEALAYLRATDEGGLDGPADGTWLPRIALWGVEMESQVRLRDTAGAKRAETETIKPGAPVRIEVELAVPVAVEERLRFGIKEIGRTVGAGTVTKVIRQRRRGGS